MDIKMKLHQIILGFTSILLLGSCAFAFDYYVPYAERKTRDFNVHTHNYQNLKMKSSEGVISLTPSSQYITGDSEINEDGLLSYAERKNKNQSDAKQVFGGYAKYLSASKTMKVPVEFDRSALRGFKFKIPLEVSATNYETETFYLKKRLRLLWTVLDIYPGFGLAFLLEDGHLWKVKNKLEIELTPTNIYSNYLEELTNFKVIVDPILEKQPNLKGRKTKDIWLISYADEKLAVMQLSNVYPSVIKNREITENDVINLQRTCEALSKSDLFTTKSQAQDKLNSINKKIKEDKFNEDMSLEVVCQDNSVSELLNTWYIENRIAKSIKSTMNYNNYWIPEIYYSSQNNAQNAINEIIEAEKREAERIKKEKEDAFNEFMDKEITCADGGIKRRRYCWIIEREMTKDISKLLDITNYERSRYTTLYSSKREADRELKERKEKANKEAAERMKAEEDFIKNNQTNINACKTSIRGMVYAIRNESTYKGKRAKKLMCLSIDDPYFGCLVKCLKRKYGEKSYNIAIQELNKNESSLMKTWNDY